MTDFRCGFVAVVGRPNVGKSTLINALVGNKISIVTAKPQTTRHRILGVRTTDDSQIVFVDTPGMHKHAAKAMNRYMNRAAGSALRDADVVLFVTEADRWTDEDEAVLKRLASADSTTFGILNKIDRVHPREALLQTIATLSERYEFEQIVPLSALKGDNVEPLFELIPPYLPISPPLYPEDTLTDRSAEFQAAEVIREKLTLCLHQEVPYGLTVQIERYERTDQGLSIDAVIWVERDSQKGIAVGKAGSVLKRVGRSARLELKEREGCPVHLELWVKVKEHWADNEQDLLRLGYEQL